MAELPDAVPPMLARSGRLFDGDDWFFEVKWDGVRAQAFVESTGLRLHSRRRRDLRARYPELECLCQLPPGTLLDGELVVLGPGGAPDFPAVVKRENARAASRIEQLRRSHPVVYVAFDLLYERGERLLEQPFTVRRQRLEVLLAAHAGPQLVLSEGIVGRGRQLFAAVRARNLEGIVAKRLDAAYRPGERSDAWRKIKATQVVHCAIVGYEPDGERDFKSLILATDLDGRLSCVGKVGTGFSMAVKAQLFALLQARCRQEPWFDPGIPGTWVEPGLYCSVSFLERTASGSLRAPVFLQLHVDP